MHAAVKIERMMGLIYIYILMCVCIGEAEKNRVKCPQAVKPTKKPLPPT